MTIGSVEPLKRLHDQWGTQVQFVDIVTRQAHPGPEVPPYHTFEQKWFDAQRYQQEEGIPWAVLVDDLAGTTHQLYGGLADPTYLIDTEGHIAFYNMWTHAPTLHRAITALQSQGWKGMVLDGIDNRPHFLPAITEGWRGLRRGLPQSFIDLETSAPLSASGTWLGHKLRPVLAPLALRAEPLPGIVRFGFAVGIALLLAGARRLRRPRKIATVDDRALVAGDAPDRAGHLQRGD